MKFLSRNLTIIALALLGNVAQGGVMAPITVDALMSQEMNAKVTVQHQTLAATSHLDLGERAIARRSQITTQQLVSEALGYLTPGPGSVRGALRPVQSSHTVLTHRAVRR